MNYFEAERNERLLRRFKKLALAYWGTKKTQQDEQEAEYHADPDPDAGGNPNLRRQLNEMQTEALQLGKRLGVNVILEWYPPPAVGGPVINTDIFSAAVDQSMISYGRLPEQGIIDALDQCIGAASALRRKAAWRMVSPWWWVVDIPALILRVPFLILRQAGVSPKIEESIFSQVFKVLMLLAAATYLGVRLSVTDLATLLGK